jgi:uncharacterized cupin superfamily protein
MSNRLPIAALEIPIRKKTSLYPEAFATRMEGREKRQIGDFFGLTNFGVNLTRLKPNAISSLRHSHSKQDEFIYILEGHPTLNTNDGETQLSPGMCIGFPASKDNAHNLVNETEEDVLYLEVGDRTLGDEAVYPDDDIQAKLIDAQWVFTHKNGDPY